MHPKDRAKAKWATKKHFGRSGGSRDRSRDVGLSWRDENRVERLRQYRGDSGDMRTMSEIGVGR